ncbi:MAG TPA: hypothetical protein VG672_22355 [Bryobacteraceae bacterium]|nr:hypothetical protein [Bryobacteraceae bacterium]
MTTALDDQKLAELRRKTDRDLVSVICKDLERGLALARVVTYSDCSAYESAVRICQEVAMLLPTVADMTETERGLVGLKLMELRRTLDQVPKVYGRTAAS